MKTSSSQSASDLPRRTLVTPQEAANFLRVHRSTIYRWVDLGTIEGIRVRGSLRIPRSELIIIFPPSTEI